MMLSRLLSPLSRRVAASSCHLNPVSRFGPGQRLLNDNVITKKHLVDAAKTYYCSPGWERRKPIFELSSHCGALRGDDSGAVWSSRDATSVQSRCSVSATSLVSVGFSTYPELAGTSVAATQDEAPVARPRDTVRGGNDLDDMYSMEAFMFPSWEKNSAVRIQSIVPSASGKTIDIWWRESDGTSPEAASTFPLIWLRDNCRCPKCFYAVTRQRKLEMKDLNANYVSVSNSEDGTLLTVTWDDGHVSQYPARWLRCNVFSDSEPDPVLDLEPTLWDASTFRERLHFFDFDDLLNDDGALFDMMYELKAQGLVFVENAPLKLGQVRRLADRIGYLCPTTYGDEFQVMSKENPSHGAYTPDFLTLHTDTTFYFRTVPIQMLHCINRSAEGGENCLVDAFKVASDIRRSDPDLFDMLVRTTLEYYDIGKDVRGDFYLNSRHPVLRLNEKGQVKKVVYSDFSRSSMLRMEVDDVGEMYRALEAFAAGLNDPANVFEHTLDNGQIMLMDNYRVLHGRKAYRVQPGDPPRHLEGGYLDWDSVFSKLRVLKRTHKLTMKPMK